MLARAVVIAPALCLALAACTAGGADLFVGATTSLQDTGLLDALTEAFREETGYDVDAVTPIVAGSGQILALARRGELDVVITHSPQAEAQLIADGDGVDRRPLMQNHFVLVGPPGDRAGVRGAAAVTEALQRIAAERATFISRGDNSGTHIRELALWEEAGIQPAGQSWYQESGAGQGQSLLVASDKGAYTLVDSSTFIVFRDRMDLEVYTTDPQANDYSVIRVNPEKQSVNEEAALAFADFLASPAAQSLIREFGREEYGEPLFLPAAPAPGATPSPVSTP